MDTFVVVLFKVKPKTEEEVRKWLMKKADKTGDFYCLDVGEGKRCKICQDEVQLLTPRTDRDLKSHQEGLPCERIEVTGLGCLTGPFDFVMTAKLPDASVAEDFIVTCIRSGEIGDCIQDTQTLIGLSFYQS